MLRQALVEQGIQAFVLGDELQTAVGALPPGQTTAPKVVVAEADARQAREIAVRFDSQLAELHRAQAAERAEIDELHQRSGPDTDVWEEWPVCPGCGRRRQTVCPICDVAGTDFPLAEYGALFQTTADLSGASAAAESAETSGSASCGGSCSCGPQAEATPRDESAVLLMCETCDEAFAPRFYRRCQWCDRDFGHGIDVRQTLAQREPLNPRAKAVMILLLLGAVAMTAYFSGLFFW